MCLLGVCLSQAAGQSSIQDVFRRAQAARSRGDLAGAEQDYLEIIRRAPQLATAFHNLGIVYFLEHRFHDSATSLEKALQLSPKLPGVHGMLGLAYYQLSDPEKAAAAFQVELRLNPSDTGALLYLGKAKIQSRDYRDAAKTLEKLATVQPSDPDVLYSLSLAYLRLMLENVNRLGAVAPRSYQAWLLLAQDEEAHGNDDAAVNNYREALRAKPNAVGIHYALGSVLGRTGKFDEAAAEFNKELQSTPNDYLSLWKLGEVTLRSSPQAALTLLERAISLAPDLAQARLAFGRALARLGETAKAVEQFQRVVKLAPEEDSVHYHLWRAYRLMGRGEEAQAELSRFEEMAKKKDERTQEMARRDIEMTRAVETPPEEPEPGFTPSRDPTHP
jgi:tetratricopeptide (TPR) repeat protein